MIRNTLKAGFALTLLLLIHLPAVAQKVAGTYAIEYPARIQNTNGDETVQMGNARLTLQVKGDSVTGTWHVLDREDAKPRDFRGTVQGNTVKFSMQTEGRINQNGEERTIKMTTDYTATVTGDNIEGTMKAYSSEMGGMSAGERKWTGKREKAD